jgi:hypothetical protein
MVSFGEFVTLMWSMDEQRKARVLLNDAPDASQQGITEE